MPFEFEKQKIEDVILVKPKVFGDNRGFFMETYKKSDFFENGITVEFNQDNHSRSRKGVLRGLHYQEAPYGQAKLVRCARGRIYDVAVDIRKGSKTFGQYVKVELTEDNKHMLFIPEGFAHGFLVLSDIAEFCYKCTDFYHPGDEGGMAWNDPQIGIQWPKLQGEYKGTASAEGYTLDDGTALNLSDKDQKWLGIKDTFKF